MNRHALLLLFCLVVNDLLSAVPIKAQSALEKENLLQQAILEYRQERFEEALELLTRARMEVPDSAITAFYLGLVHKQTGDYESAAGYYREALKLHPRVNDAYPELIETLIRMEQLEEAETLVLLAQSEGILPDQIAFLKGLILARKGENADAITSFQDARKHNPGLASATELQIAILQAQEGRIREARNRLDVLSAMDPDTDQADFAREYSKSLTRLMETHRSWNITLSAEGRYDDNVVAKPSANIRGLDITGEKDTGLLTTFQAAYTPLLDRPFSLNAQFSMSALTYRDTSSHNLLQPAISLTPGWHFRQGMFSAPLFWNHTWLGGEEYMENLGIRPSFFLNLHPGHMARFSLGYTQRNMRRNPGLPAENRDGSVYTATAAYFHSLARFGGLLHLMYEYIDDKADGKNWENQAHRYGAGLLQPFAKVFRLSLSLEQLSQNYTHTHTVFGLRRKNRSTAWTAQLFWEYSPALLFSLTYTGSQDDDNIPIYEYRRNVYGAGVEYRF